jgi:hypothetical protein
MKLAIYALVRIMDFKAICNHNFIKIFMPLFIRQRISEFILVEIIFCLQDESLNPSTKYTMKSGPKDVAPRLYLMKGESENLQFPLSTTISSSISSKILNLVAE